MPQLVDQPVARDDLARMEHKEGEQSALPAAAQFELSSVLEHLERTQDTEFHPSMVRCVRGSCNEPATGGRDPRLDIDSREA